MLKHILVAATALTLTPTSLASANESRSAEALISVVATEISQSNRQQIADAVLNNLDVQAIARFTLGRHGKTLSDQDKARYVTAFESFLHRQISNNADQFVGVELTVTKTLARNDHDAVVTTVVDRAGDRQTLRWRVIERGGKWSVVDLEFAGIWLAIEQRAQVSAILDRPGANIETLIAEFE